MANNKSSTPPAVSDPASAFEKIPTKVLFSWEAPIRPFKKRDKEFFSTAGAIAFLVGVILIFLKEWFLIVAIIALLFLVYILSTIPPEKTKHEITNKGIATGGRDYGWGELGNFWFSEQWEQKILNVEVPFQFPARLFMLLGDEKEEEVKKHLTRFLEHQESAPTWVDKASNWLSEKVPLERPAS